MKKTKLFLSSIILFLVFGLTASAQAQWTFAGFITGAGTYPAICVYGPTSAIVAGGPSGVPKAFKTTNGGATWTDISGNMTGPELGAVWTWDGTTIFVGDQGGNGGSGGNAKTWKTTNGGVSWTTILTTGGSLGFINGIAFSRVTPSVGFVQSDPPLGGSNPYWVQKTTDGGTTWTLQSPSPPGAVASANYSPMIIDNLFYGWGLNAAPARVALTINGGTSFTFTTIPAGGTMGFVPTLSFKEDKLNGVSGGNGFTTTISKTTDGGVSWSTLNIGGGVSGGYCNLKWIWGTNTIYLAGETGAAGVVKRSTDAGVTWTQMSTNSITGIRHMEYYKASASSSATYLMAICSDGSVLYYADVVGIDPNNHNVPSEFRLEQNYPNPFNPSTTIKYALPQASHVTLKIYDMLGNEVMSVVNSYQTPGNYVETIDASSLSSGVYFYKLNAGSFTDSKKMSVVK